MEICHNMRSRYDQNLACAQIYEQLFKVKHELGIANKNEFIENISVKCEVTPDIYYEDTDFIEENTGSSISNWNYYNYNENTGSSISNWNNYNFKKHVRINSEGVKEHKCDSCGKCFKQAIHLKTHIKSVHEGIKDQKCDFCGKCFARDEYFS